MSRAGQSCEPPAGEPSRDLRSRKGLGSVPGATSLPELRLGAPLCVREYPLRWAGFDTARRPVLLTTAAVANKSLYDRKLCKFYFSTDTLMKVVMISKLCKDQGERSCVFLLQGSEGAWAVLLEASLAPASRGAGFSRPGPPAAGPVLVLALDFVSVRSWTRTCSQAPPREVTSGCCWAVGDGLSLFGGRESPSPRGRAGSPQPLGSVLTRSCAPGAILTPGQWLCRGHGSVPAHLCPLAALGMGHG